MLALGNGEIRPNEANRSCFRVIIKYCYASLSLFSPLGHGIIGTFELARTLNDIEPNAFILEMSMWLVLMEVTRSFSRGETEKEQ